MTYQERQAEIARIKADHHGILATPLISEGAISSTQICRMGNREREQWQKNTMIKMDLLYKIKCLEKSDEQLMDEHTREATRAMDQRLMSINARIQLIEGLGRMSHKKNGKLRDNYQRQMDEILTEKGLILAA